ncbi:hypothetical protein DRE_03395 [Drechslerella stenobrocha 248]|uniref:Uncharacterized protein n=1 Tax=Drechslerella stenobrocha 248 TaxID=1043628 RepID=W7HT51_9PEZI|nr:hypothetical protein DRE_03395 [Drechslerella stenobrocha 248]
MVFGAKAAYDISDKNSRMGKCFGRAIFNSPVMQRERATGGGNNPGDLLAVWYGPDPPTPEDTLRVRQMQLQLQLELELEQELAAQQQQLDAKGLLLDPFDLGFDPERVILV